MKKIGCPVAFYEEVNARLWKKMCQIDTENDKKKNKFSIFQSFYAIFVKCLKDFKN